MYSLKPGLNLAPRDLGGFFDEVFNNGFHRPTENLLHYPPVNITEEEAAYQLELVAPGFRKEDFKVKLDKNLLQISCEQKEVEKQEDTGKRLRTEFKLRSFKRTFSLNEKVDTTNISATYADGILTLTLPKKQEAQQELREIAIG